MSRKRVLGRIRRTLVVVSYSTFLQNTFRVEREIRSRFFFPRRKLVRGNVNTPYAAEHTYSGHKRPSNVLKPGTHTRQTLYYVRSLSCTTDTGVHVHYGNLVREVFRRALCVCAHSMSITTMCTAFRDRQISYNNCPRAGRRWRSRDSCMYT